MKLIPFICLAAAPALLPVYAVQQAETYAESQAIVQDDGYIIFAYAEDWDTFSKQVCDKLMESELVTAAAGNAVFMRAPIPNFLTPERTQADKERFGPLQVGDAPSYPAVLMLTKEGRLYSIISGSFMRKAAPKKVSKMIAERLAAFKKQKALLIEAEHATGVEQARLLGQAFEIPDLLFPVPRGKMIDRIRKLDPKDESGYARRLRDPFDFVGEIVGIEKNKDRGWEEALAQVEKYLADPVYTPAHKMALHALATGLLRRHGGIKAAPDIRRHTQAIVQLQAQASEEGNESLSYLAKSAPNAAREWAAGFNLADGWTPAVMQASGEPIELGGPLPIKLPGVYTVTFLYESGADAAIIRSVELRDGDTPVAEDRHNGFAGKNPNNNVYTLKVTEELKQPRLFITFDQKGKNNSSGHITITRGK